MHARPALTRPQRYLIATAITGAVVIAAIGFVGSYGAVRELAEEKDLGRFAAVFPIGIDAGIVVLLALDLLLAWLRIPFPLLRQTAWLLTAATIAFNAATAWPDPIGVGMHAVTPILFVISVEAGRHAVGRIADITADKHMEGVRLSRWLLSPLPTFKLWRRMKLWELRSYEQVIGLEQDRLIYQARLRAEYGRAWRWSAPVDKRLQLRLARYGRPVDAPVAQPLASVPVQPDAFDTAASEAVALAPPRTAAALTAAQPPVAVAAQPYVPALAPAPVAVQPQPPVPPAAAAPERGVLILDLAPMLAPYPEVTADAQPPVQPQPPVQSTARLSDELLISQAVELADTAPLTQRRLQRELRVGQRRAPRILAAAEERIRVAAQALPAAAPAVAQPPPAAAAGVQP